MTSFFFTIASLALLTLKTLPSALNLSPAVNACMYLIDSTTADTGLSHLIPRALRVTLSPAPIPMTARPLLSSLIVTAAEAVNAGLL